MVPTIYYLKGVRASHANSLYLTNHSRSFDRLFHWEVYLLADNWILSKVHHSYDMLDCLLDNRIHFCRLIPGPVSIGVIYGSFYHRLYPTHVCKYIADGGRT